MRRKLGATLTMHGGILAVAIAWTAVVRAEPPADSVPPRATSRGALPRPQDEVWVVSSRGLSGGRCDQRAELLHYWRYGDEGWQPATLDDLAQPHTPDATTSIFVPGNGYTHGEVVRLGWSAYAHFVQQAVDERPIRFVIWSWPSDKIEGPAVEDLRIKAARADLAAYYLAWVVDRLDPEMPLSLIGTSYGARIVTGGLHLLGGGKLPPNSPLQRSNDARRPIRLVLITAAIDADWLVPGHRHGAALGQVEQVLLINNSTDRVLRRYHFLYGLRSDARALGCQGCAPGWYGRDAGKVLQTDVARLMGSQHGCGPYFATPQLVARMEPYVFCRPSDDRPTGEARTMEAE